jgi:methylthioribulose-1-phosphate dehydratase
VIQSFQESAIQLAGISRLLYARGWVLGTSGNFSAVVSRDPLRLAISPSGVDKGLLSADQILLIDEHARVVGEHSAKPSDECPLHLRVVLERGAGAVLHTHSVWSTTLSDLFAAEEGLSFAGYEMLKGLAGVQTHEHREWLPIIENSQNLPMLASVVSRVLRENQASHGFLLRRHGLYTWGKDLAQAKRHCEILEFLLEALGRTRLMTNGGKGRV